MQHSISSRLINKLPRHLNSFTWGSDSLLTVSERFTVLQLRTMAWGLEVHARSHESHHPRTAGIQSRGHQSKHATSRLFLQIFSMKIKSRIVEKAQAWLSPTASEKVIEFLSQECRISTLQLYEDRVPRSNNPFQNT